MGSLGCSGQLHGLAAAFCHNEADGHRHGDAASAQAHVPRLANSLWGTALLRLWTARTLCSPRKQLWAYLYSLDTLYASPTPLRALLPHRLSPGSRVVSEVAFGALRSHHVSYGVYEQRRLRRPGLARASHAARLEWPNGGMWLVACGLWFISSQGRTHLPPCGYVVRSSWCVVMVTGWPVARGLWPAIAPCSVFGS